MPVPYVSASEFAFKKEKRIEKDKRKEKTENHKSIIKPNYLQAGWLDHYKHTEMNPNNIMLLIIIATFISITSMYEQ